jgi:hypothetical protein
MHIGHVTRRDGRLPEHGQRERQSLAGVARTFDVWQQPMNARLHRNLL